MYKITLQQVKEMAHVFIGYLLFFLVFTSLYMLKPLYMSVVCIVLVLSFPIHIYCEKKYRIEKQRFEELTLYLHYMMIHYKISGKIKKSLQDTLSVFASHTRIYRCMNNAINAIDTGYDFEYAFSLIEEYYYNSYSTQIHRYMIMGEMSVGDAVFRSLSQVNVKAWQQNVEQLQKEKLKIKRYNFRYACIALVVAYLPIPFLQDFLSEIKHDRMYQFITCLFFILFVIVFACIPFILTGKWVNEKE